MTPIQMKTTQTKTSTTSNLQRVLAHARRMPGLRPVNRDVHQSSHALLALMTAMSVNPEHNKQ